VGDIKRRAEEMRGVRSSPGRYRAVTSKVNSNNAKKTKKKAKGSPKQGSSPVRNTQFGQTTLTEKTL